MEKYVQQYKQAVRVIKDAILYSQYRAAKLVTGEQLSLYFGIGAYVSLIWQPSAAKLQLSINQDTIDTECFSLQKCSPMASEINREELRNVLPDMDEMRKLLINESDTDN